MKFRHSIILGFALILITNSVNAAEIFTGNDKERIPLIGTSCRAYEKEVECGTKNSNGAWPYFLVNCPSIPFENDVWTVVDNAPRVFFETCKQACKDYEDSAGRKCTPYRRTGLPKLEINCFSCEENTYVISTETGASEFFFALIHGGVAPYTIETDNPLGGSIVVKDSKIVFDLFIHQSRNPGDYPIKIKVYDKNKISFVEQTFTVRVNPSVSSSSSSGSSNTNTPSNPNPSSNPTSSSSSKPISSIYDDTKCKNVGGSCKLVSGSQSNCKTGVFLRFLCGGPNPRQCCVDTGSETNSCELCVNTQDSMWCQSDKDPSKGYCADVRDSKDSNKPNKCIKGYTERKIVQECKPGDDSACSEQWEGQCRSVENFVPDNDDTSSLGFYDDDKSLCLSNNDPAYQCFVNEAINDCTSCLDFENDNDVPFVWCEKNGKGYCAYGDTKPKCIEGYNSIEDQKYCATKRERKVGSDVTGSDGIEGKDCSSRCQQSGYNKGTCSGKAADDADFVIDEDGDTCDNAADGYVCNCYQRLSNQDFYQNEIVQKSNQDFFSTLFAFFGIRLDNSPPVKNI